MLDWFFWFAFTRYIPAGLILAPLLQLYCIRDLKGWIEFYQATADCCREQIARANATLKELHDAE